MNQSYVSLKLLLSKMQELFETIEPSISNRESYGHKTRELLLLASMEVEASWSAILKANGYEKRRPTTSDYVKLKVPMILDSYSLSLRSYLSYPQFSPFIGWELSAPTQSLCWYDAYNSTKHNREEHLNVATLQNTISAVGAAAIMFVAQFGFRPPGGDDKIGFIKSTFDFKLEVDRYPTSVYIPNAGTRPGSPKPVAWDWVLRDYPFPQ